MKTQEIIGRIERTAKYHFWHPSTHACGRRLNEQKHSFKAKVEYEGEEYTVEMIWRESTRHVYRQIIMEVDGVKKDIRAVKKLPADLDWHED